jgi:phosphoserine phosphatase RsbU/P
VERPRILVVDDDTAQRRAVERVLEGTYEVVAAPGAGEALLRVKAAPFDLALVDIRMPGMDGLELLGHLKAVDPVLDVILMTGSTTDGDARLIRAVRGGAFYFIQKPFHRDVLLSLVQRCMEIRRLQRAERAHTERLATELEAARRFQDRMLPPTTAAYPGLELAICYEPSLELCGDFFEHESVQGGVALLLADVAGKGVAAAMLTGMVKQAFRGSAGEAFAPAIVLQRAFDGCKIYPGGRHLTACAARIRIVGDRLELLGTAGHPPAYLITGDGTLTQLPSSADPLHPAFDTWGFEQRTFDFGVGASFVAFTDGLIESRRAEEDEIFGIERVEEALRAAPRDSASILCRAIRESLRRFQQGRPPEDDLTILVARRTA